MVLCIIDTNAAKYSPELLHQLVDVLAKCFEALQNDIMVEINTKKTFFLRGSAPCAYVQCRSVEPVSDENHLKFNEVLNHLIADGLAIHRSRVVIEFIVIERSNLAVFGSGDHVEVKNH
ncbi:hypothetical protein L596_028925 [Steinernema carpocapsae]|uniref:Macrophage migration inhibitory factor n=1 Tax=Steinernema carpocapsae TaxID=34508 RepID=A0A4U5LZY7_STECR|nr:hypothetical protein L596_028925 [Steinernema carpocapsae]